MMSELVCSLPPLLELSDFDGDWKRYIDTVFGEFHRDFLSSQPKLNRRWVRCRRDPIYDGKEAGFWHCTSEGPAEDERIPDLRRCERIRWIRYAIEHDEVVGVDHWTNRRGNEIRHLFWVNEEFLVVVGERIRKRDGFQYMQLITAYCTMEESRKRKLRKERDGTRNG